MHGDEAKEALCCANQGGRWLLSRALPALTAQPLTPAKLWEVFYQNARSGATSMGMPNSGMLIWSSLRSPGAVTSALMGSLHTFSAPTNTHDYKRKEGRRARRLSR